MQPMEQTIWYTKTKAEQAVKTVGQNRLVKGAAGITAALAGVVSLPVGAQGIPGMLAGWSEAIQAGIDFIILLALLIGIGGILYGLKLIVDKSNDRDDVKTSRIVVSLVGGSLLCIIWFVITVLVETTGGSAGDIGRAATY